MYEIKWDKRSGAIRLSESSESTVKGEVRPVFHEELDLLGFEAHWKYPKCEEPLLWAIGRKYHHKGEEVASTKGGGFYCKPNVTVHKKQLSLKPINVSKMIINNDYLLDGLQHRAIEFIARVYSDYLPKVDIASVAFSGGKDSLVLLDLVQRSLRPDQFIVTFSDTTMELDSTYETIERSKKYWSQLTFLEAKSPFDAKTSWRLFGPPSRILRWCCTVHKTAPSIAAIKEYLNRKAIRILVFDGCRRSESNRRAGYDDISTGKKHCIQTNASPILDWNSAEIFLYLLKYRIPMNSGYQKGYARMGCAVCPLAGSWWDSLVYQADYKTVEPYLYEITNYAKGKGLKNREDIESYITDGGWKGRMGGRALAIGGNRVAKVKKGNSIFITVRNSQDQWKSWLTILGKMHLYSVSEGEITTIDGPIKYKYNLNNDNLEVIITPLSKLSKGTEKNIVRIFMKDAYCVRCGACEASCPTGALSVGDTVSIDLNLCTRCYECLEVSSKGCFVAKSLSTTEGSMMRLQTYQHFGIRKEWLDGFLADPMNWWHSDKLGNRQFDSMKLWLKHALLFKNNHISKLGLYLAQNCNEQTLWEIVWLNLSIGSNLVSWYIENTDWNTWYEKGELLDLLPEKYSISTKNNAILALTNTFRDSPIGKMGVGEVETDKSGRRIKRVYRRCMSAISMETLLYILYIHAAEYEIYQYTIDSLLESKFSPYRVFGLSRDGIRKILRGLSLNNANAVRIEIASDLENVFLNDQFIHPGI